MSLRVGPMPPEALPWLCERAGCAWTPSLRALWALDEKGVIQGAVGFDGWMGNAACVHIALEKKIALRALIRPSFIYLFNDCGKDIALGFVPSHNHRALRLDKHLGFKEIFRIQDGYAPGDDIVVLRMHKSECRMGMN